METIYVALLDEGVEVWRPVKAAKISEAVYELEPNQTDTNEIWEFPPGARVNVEWKKLSGGMVLVATSLSENK